MKRIDLKKIDNITKVGTECGSFEPNITEDCIFYLDGEPIGFFMKILPLKMQQLANISNKEFQSKNVPKTKLERSDVLKALNENPKLTRAEAQEIGTVQMSCILGGVPPKAQFKRPYPNLSSVHRVKSAKNFIKAMLLLALESEKLIKEIIPNQHEKQLKILEKISSKYKFANLFTSSISNFNISAPFHKDTGNLKDCVNVIITKRKDAKGGNLHVPDYGITIDSTDNSILVYPAWKNIHGVTPILPLKENGYRNSLIFYPLRAFVGW